MTDNYNKYWLIYLLLIGIHSMTIHSYGDLEALNDDMNDINISNKVTTESLIGSMNAKHRVKRAVGDPTSISPEETTNIPTSTNSTYIYIINGYSNLGSTMQTTADTQTSQITSISSTPSITTNVDTNGTYIIIVFDPITTVETTLFTTTATITVTNQTTIPSTTVTTSTTTSAIICNIGTHIILSSGTCVSRESLIDNSLAILNSSSATDTDKAGAIVTYITAVTKSNISLNSANTLTINTIDKTLSNLTSTNYTASTNDSIIIITQPKLCPECTTIIGASVKINSGATVVNTENKNNVLNSSLTAAATISLSSLYEVKSFNMLIINNPTIYQNIDNSSNKTLASSIITATINKEGENPDDVVIYLYFQVITPPDSGENVQYSCSFYDTNSSQWNDTGCSPAIYNSTFNRYECYCNHLTSFALIWLPQSSQSPDDPSADPPGKYNAQDIASIVFQCISIICFLGIIIHGIVVQIINPQKYSLSTHLLPLMSYGITMLLFIFYIALGLTVYSRFAQSNTQTETSTQHGKIFEKNLQNKIIPRANPSSTNSPPTHILCLTSEYALMYIVYFLIIFMFCSKTSIGIFNYRRYVQLFPPPKLRTLTITMSISFLISVICLVFAVGFNSRPSNEIAEIYSNKICWFNHSVLHYFLTIPICIFLAINLIMFIPVVKHNISHAQIKDEDIPYYIRRKRCIYILLASGVILGFGWFFGVVIPFIDAKAANVVGWFFIIINGLEGVWAIILYYIVKEEGMDTKRRHADDSDNGQEFYNIQDDVRGFRTDDSRDDRLGEQLAAVKSDSPRNSFANFSETQPRHRDYQVNNADRL